MQLFDKKLMVIPENDFIFFREYIANFAVDNVHYKETLLKDQWLNPILGQHEECRATRAGNYIQCAIHRLGWLEKVRREPPSLTTFFHVILSTAAIRGGLSDNATTRRDWDGGDGKLGFLSCGSSFKEFPSPEV